MEQDAQKTLPTLTSTVNKVKSTTVCESQATMDSIEIANFGEEDKAYLENLI